MPIVTDGQTFRPLVDGTPDYIIYNILLDGSDGKDLGGTFKPVSWYTKTSRPLGAPLAEDLYKVKAALFAMTQLSDNKLNITKSYTLPQVIRSMTSGPYALPVDEPVQYELLFQYYLDIADQLYKDLTPAQIHPELYKSLLEPYKPDIWDKAIKVVATLTVVYVAAQGLKTLFDDVPVLDAIGDKIGDVADNVFSLDTVIDIGGNIAKDTLEDYLNNIRKDILDEVDKLDNQTFLNLSYLNDTINDSMKTIINTLGDLTLALTDKLADALQDKISGVDKAIADAGSNERKALEEIQISGGVGFAAGLQRILFRTKTKGVQ